MRHFFFSVWISRKLHRIGVFYFFIFFGLSLRRESVLARERERERCEDVKGGFDVGAKLTLSGRERERERETQSESLVR